MVVVVYGKQGGCRDVMGFDRPAVALPLGAEAVELLMIRGISDVQLKGADSNDGAWGVGADQYMYIPVSHR